MEASGFSETSIPDYTASPTRKQCFSSAGPLNIAGLKWKSNVYFTSNLKWVKCRNVSLNRFLYVDCGGSHDILLGSWAEATGLW
jgi:hypothetical protein